MPSTTLQDINLRALACIQRHTGHVMVNLSNKLKPQPQRVCIYCSTPYSQVLDGTDPFVHIYSPTDITIRPVVQENIHCNKTLDDLPDWYMRQYGRRQLT